MSQYEDVNEFDFTQEEDFSSAEWDEGWYEIEVVKTELYEGKTSKKKMIKVTSKINELKETVNNYIQLDSGSMAKKTRKQFLEAVSDKMSFGVYNDEKVFEHLCGITCYGYVKSEDNDGIAIPKIVKFAAEVPEGEEVYG